MPNVSQKRKTLTKVVTLDVNYSSEVISDSKVITEPVRQSSVANVSRKRKQIPVTPEEDSGVSDGTVVTPKKRGIVKVVKPVSALAVPKSVEPFRQSSVANVSRKRKQIPVTPEEDSGVSDGTVVTPKKRGIVKVVKPVSALAVPKSVEPQTDVEDVTTGKALAVPKSVEPQTDVEDMTTGKAAVVTKKIRKPTLVPTAVIPLTSQSQGSDYDDDSQIDAEENAYWQQLAQTQIAANKKSGKGKGKGKVKKDLPEGATIFCTKCHEVFDTADDLSVHEKNCFIGRRYPCPYAGCSHVNSQNSLLEEHIKGVHENNPFRCELCPNEVFI